MSVRVLRGFCFWLLVLVSTRAHAQSSAPPELAPGQAVEEAPDSTRLDVARLPPEAVDITRDMYAHGLFLEAHLGALGFVGDAGKVSKPEPRFAVDIGYELFDWLSVLLQVEGSLHQTKNRPPPRQTSYELIGAALGLRLTAPFGPRAALWLDALAGYAYAGGDVLRTLGFADSLKPKLNYGGELGFDWHMRSPHHSIGLLGGARLYPGLTRGDYTLGCYGALYLRYVF